MARKSLVNDLGNDTLPEPLEAPGNVGPENEYNDLKVENADGLVPFFLSSDGVETINKNGQQFAFGSINGVRFEILCNEQVMVKPEQKHVFDGLLAMKADPAGFANSLKAVV